jgi:hypothetical protein
MTGQPAHDHALSELAASVAVYIDRAPGPMEKRLVLMRAFAQAHRLNPTVTDDPDLTLLDLLIREPDRLVQKLLTLWNNHGTG